MMINSSQWLDFSFSHFQFRKCIFSCGEQTGMRTATVDRLIIDIWMVIVVFGLPYAYHQAQCHHNYYLYTVLNSLPCMIVWYPHIYYKSRQVILQSQLNKHSANWHVPFLSLVCKRWNKIKKSDIDFVEFVLEAALMLSYQGILTI